MKNKLLYLLTLLFLSGSCANKNKINIENNINDLKKRINIEGLNPLSVKFVIKELGQNNRVAGPTDYNLVAILQLSEADWGKLKNDYFKETDINNKIYLDKDFIQYWFSDSVKKSFFLEDGYYRIRPKVYSPDQFLKSPFVGGMIFFTTNNQVFIFMHTN